MGRICTISFTPTQAFTNTVEYILVNLPKKYRPMQVLDFTGGTGGRIRVQTSGDVYIMVAHTSAVHVNFSHTYITYE